MCGDYILCWISNVRNIYRKLKRLKQKELAERRMESKLLEKRIIFMDDEDELVLDEMDHSSLLKDTGATEIKMNYISSTRYGADMKDSLLMNEMTPQRRNQHKGRNVTTSSSLHQHWIISIEDVEIFTPPRGGGEPPSEENDEFEKEASLLASIRHPNIVQFFGVIVSGSRKYMVVEFMEKKSLDLAIYNSKNGIEKLSIFRKIDILLGVAKGMQYLHAMKPFGGIIHRDLKPGNILLDKNFTAKIADFGLSKHLSTRNASNFSTSNQESNATANVGTLFYMSNEMISGTKYNHKTDVYSFGIVMWELFFEENPYLNAHSKKLHHFTTKIYQ
ncbi:hypothetical protein C9374_002741 [Naegleria lovaniensis]|uniref:non-specific serine/threonine protein kinase n=1 Tax=Naegleria lovaniensis TaxID=51637 RepID=A0AA88GSY3_NAELO|nr:uncharacterized protein C9374_002741 [Naegleria lovaniensis]KAG2386295.1 hypothetical protein C9374_002741 [Naegleria lovaniensis]